jgi:glycosyltransferase involved in cell wall biosynthesis
MSEGMTKSLSIVTITKNLEWNIERLVNSVMTKIPNVAEFVLVDSASTDKTVEVACQLPIKVIQLDANQRLTAAAGRYVGYLNTTGDNILFLDGDVELLEKWHTFALDILEKHPEIGAVGGRYINVPKTGAVDVAIERHTPPVIEDVSHCSGAAAIYRREVLDKTGAFSPHLFSDEEAALATRIRHIGYRVVRLDYPAVLHYTDPPEEVSMLLAQRRRNYWIGYGQNIRNFMGTGMLIPYLRQRGYAIAPTIVLVISILFLGVTIILGRWLWIVWFFAAGMGLFLLLAIYKRSLRDAFFTVFRRFIILEGTVRGFFLDPSIKPENYHVDFKVIK